MPALLVSVRSAAEARAASDGGAAIVDVKEPARGPLGPADPATWRAVRAALPVEVPVSVALGELADWDEGRLAARGDFDGIAFRKVGLAGERGRGDWPRRWRCLRESLGPGPRWVAVAYADWSIAGSPEPAAVLAEALAVPDCDGLLVDTWDKGRRVPILVEDWADWAARARAGGRLVVLAGGLDADAIARLGPIAPDLFAVRGAACDRGDRLGTIDPARVAGLARAAAAARAGLPGSFATR
ncbi:MAG TPA: (5-formylfuran-3-yl)methyl phosphate synthase [Isosphaeraceae bacterium]|jgi:hypothetical protein|nr:(5-formylfuran-3-yl)methyl phosphate synthase [Isosphaeraceae bacterium]